MDKREKALHFHQEHKGKIAITSKVKVDDKESLALAYTPGVAEPCKEIAQNAELSYTYTSRGNMVAVVSDGSAVLGLGNIGPYAALPVMEGKCLLFKQFANVDAFPLCLDTQDSDEIVETVVRLAPSFGGINLEDISAPRCFEIEEKLKQRLALPIFHDDQHGTAIVVLAALLNASKVVNKSLASLKIVLSGAGAAGIAIAKLLMLAGVQDIILCNSKGILDERQESLDSVRKEMAEKTNPRRVRGTLADALMGANVFLGVSAPGIVSKEMVASMQKDSIVLAMANPVPEIYPDEALAGGARVVGTGRSDFPNQVNNVLAFPAIFRAAFDARKKEITEEMKLACAFAIAEEVEKPTETEILPSAFKEGMAQRVAQKILQKCQGD